MGRSATLTWTMQKRETYDRRSRTLAKFGDSSSCLRMRNFLFPMELTGMPRRREISSYDRSWA